MFNCCHAGFGNHVAAASAGSEGRRPKRQRKTLLYSDFKDVE